MESRNSNESASNESANSVREEVRRLHGSLSPSPSPAPSQSEPCTSCLPPPPPELQPDDKPIPDNPIVISSTSSSFPSSPLSELSAPPSAGKSPSVPKEKEKEKDKDTHVALSSKTHDSEESAPHFFQARPTHILSCKLIDRDSPSWLVRWEAHKVTETPEMKSVEDMETWESPTGLCSLDDGAAELVQNFVDQLREEAENCEEHLETRKSNRNVSPKKGKAKAESKPDKKKKPAQGSDDDDVRLLPTGKPQKGQRVSQLRGGGGRKGPRNSSGAGEVDSPSPAPAKRRQATRGRQRKSTFGTVQADVTSDNEESGTTDEWERDSDAFDDSVDEYEYDPGQEEDGSDEEFADSDERAAKEKSAGRSSKSGESPDDASADTTKAATARQSKSNTRSPRNGKAAGGQRSKKASDSSKNQSRPSSAPRSKRKRDDGDLFDNDERDVEQSLRSSKTPIKRDRDDDNDEVKDGEEEEGEEGEERKPIKRAKKEKRGSTVMMKKGKVEVRQASTGKTSKKYLKRSSPAPEELRGPDEGLTADDRCAIFERIFRRFSDFNGKVEHKDSPNEIEEGDDQEEMFETETAFKNKFDFLEKKVRAKGSQYGAGEGVRGSWSDIEAGILDWVKSDGQCGRTASKGSQRLTPFQKSRMFLWVCKKFWDGGKPDWKTIGEERNLAMVKGKRSSNERLRQAYSRVWKKKVAEALLDGKV